MPQCVVIADDLTGGNATGVQLKNSGFIAKSILDEACLAQVCSDKLCDCVVYSTDSRSLPADLAYRKVYEATKLLSHAEYKLISKRIDSTLRGNIARETDAMLDALEPGTVAIIVPTFPSSGRTVIGGYLLVNGVLLHKTDIARDPKCPVKSAKVADVFSISSRKSRELHVDELSKGSDALCGRIRQSIAEGASLLMFDAVTDEDLDVIARAVHKSGIRFCTVDSGAFVASYARLFLKPQVAPHSEKNHILSVIGSVHPATAAQADLLLRTFKAVQVRVITAELLESAERREAEINRVVSYVVEHAAGEQLCCVTGDGLDPNKRIDFAFYEKKLNLSLEEVSQLINDAYALITKQILDRCPLFGALYTSGGDITVTVCKLLKSSGIVLKDEVLPLAAYGVLSDGAYQGLHLVTKGGSQGGETAILQCIRYLKRQLVAV